MQAKAKGLKRVQAPSLEDKRAQVPSLEDKKAQVPSLEKKRALRRAEVESFLGDQVKTPTGIPDGYAPTDRSVHPLFHVELAKLTYAGPLDLLLYLVRKHEMDILDIPIAALTDAYLDMLSKFEALEIDLAAEFLVMASELIHIKSKMLLPADEGVPVETEDERDENKDPRSELIRRLLDYQKYRDAAFQLNDRDQLGRDVFARVPPDLDRLEDLVDPGLKPVSVFRLVEAMAKMLDALPQHHEVSLEAYDLSERIQYISAFGEAHSNRFTLVSLTDTMKTRSEMVVTFVALLEMVKMGLVSVEALPSEAEEPKPTANAIPEPDPAPPEEVSLQSEISAIESLLEEARREPPLGESAVEFPLPPPAERAPLEPLPDVWLQLTAKRFVGEVQDDYAG